MMYKSIEDQHKSIEDQIEDQIETVKEKLTDSVEERKLEQLGIIKNSRLINVKKATGMPVVFDIADFKKLYLEGKSLSEIALQLNLTKSYVWWLSKKLKLVRKKPKNKLALLIVEHNLFDKSPKKLSLILGCTFASARKAKKNAIIIQKLIEGKLED